MKARSSLLIAAISVVLASCGLTPEQIATMTAAAWTPTPVPTPTATPIPFDLTVHVADLNGTPLQGAKVVIKESGSAEPVVIDASGQHTWNNLQGPSVTLSVSAPGYYSALQPVTLERGLSEMAVVLQPDPLALQIADACGPGERLLYLEDFQNGEAPNWHVTAGDAAAWSIAAQDDGNHFASMSGIGVTQVELRGFTFGNIVWRIKAQASGNDGEAFLNLKHFRADGDSRYSVQWGPTSMLGLLRGEGSADEQKLAGSQFRARVGRWYYVEASSYEGLLQVWVDGKKQVEVQDASPLPPGTISLESHINADPKMAYLFDDISVCELNAPMNTSLFKPPAQ
ncbi:MAG TPA: carboxypeptidase regulatory-like domain-containing protein [Anaerolineales bacterium]